MSYLEGGGVPASALIPANVIELFLVEILVVLVFSVFSAYAISVFPFSKRKKYYSISHKKWSVIHKRVPV